MLSSIAFQANTGLLGINTNGTRGNWADTDLGMMTGTSPSIAALPGGGYVVAFHANTGHLGINVNGARGSWSDADLGMKAGTSPSIAALPGGGYVVAFQANTGVLGINTNGTRGNWADTDLGMMTGTSPSIAALPGGGYVVAFHANTGHLGINVNGARGRWSDTDLGMKAGTSPSILQIVPIVVPPPPPTIDSFLPMSGNAGTPVVIRGSNFTRVTAVTFNSIPSNFTAVSADRINALVPTPATSGPISVVTASGTASSATPFIVGTEIGSLAFANQTNETVITVWVVDSTTGDSAGQTLNLNETSETATFHTGHQYQYFVTSHKAVAEYNARFGTNVDPQAKETALTANFQRASSAGPIQGVDGGSSVTVPIY